MTGRISPRACAFFVAAILGVTLLSSAGARPYRDGNVGWGGFGNTPDELRHSPLTQINAGNVDRLNRVFAVDFRAIDPTVRRGEQSYPVEKNGTLYVTTNDDNVWALNAVTGKVKWRWTPDNVAAFRNFGIVANRGVALCDGHVFILTLDMTIVSLNPATGRLQRRVPIAKAVPGASSNYGYSETSAPICANHRLIVGAAGSEYGVRGFVMAYYTNLTPAWPNPFWTIPPAGTSWRRFGTLVGGGVVWTPTTVDTTTNTLYFGTGSATPLYFPSIRPGSNPRSDSLIAVNLITGRMRWWQQQMAHNEWAYDTAQPPLVYTANVGGKRLRVVSVGTMEGVWFAYDARTGRPIYQRVKVIDRTEHPSLRPGKPVAVFPASIGGLNYSPASFDRHTNYIFNAAAETASLNTQAKLTPSQKKRKFTLGDVFLGLQNGNFGAVLPSWHDYGSISAIDVRTGRRVWKFKTPEPERGGVTTTESGLGFAGGGDGVLRVFSLKNGKVLRTFRTGHPIASGASIYSVGGTEYVAITSGGTPTSSNGGTATELHVFALRSSAARSASPERVVIPRPVPVRRLAATPARPSRPSARPQGYGSIVTQRGLTVRPWRANSSNVRRVTGRVLWNRAPVAGARVSVNGYALARRTGKDGSFRCDVDITQPRRHVVRVVGLAKATVHGRQLTAGRRSALRGTSGGFSVGYRVYGVKAQARKDGTVFVRGRVGDVTGKAPPSVRLLTYQLQGTVTDASGKPVAGAVVITRTLDRDFWTHSSATDSRGRYTSFFAASDESADDPVVMSVGVASGGTSYGGVTGTNVPFARLKSAVMNVRLGSGSSYTIGKPTSRVGAVYSGLIVGVTSGGRVIKPVSERWPDRRGVFSMTLPASARGKALHFWENQRQLYSRFSARPGGPVDVRSWPARLTDAVPAGLTTVRAPRR